MKPDSLSNTAYLLVVLFETFVEPEFITKVEYGKWDEEDIVVALKEEIRRIGSRWEHQGKPIRFSKQDQEQAFDWLYLHRPIHQANRG